ncbi:PREDICTED: protein indeterminate-domain 4, chloroplastic [Tarenaya hassleriana]|uniref:protein indeterminate-domain 4, chloroplastic n=1 Tax=Tarenaya hassleriana TaxID=28532 RepID=UPI00053C861C|nr:PREDICTED: protein indeterminate-domain 4, chloroplastic [Tarenaya hassleriana]XP_010527849.1 PREDICTED: protein indeterminate-domain 4, chloroplastic [Tarenaya hassleriana]
MSSSYTISSSSSHPFLFTAAAAAPTGENDFNRKETPTMMPPHNPSAPPPKKRRNQPGNPNPDAEVIALSPKTLMTTNRFICEVCNKGFQREQNLQLHRRGHNLPWKLKQKSNKEVKRKVYLCPEPTCVHHDPSRALGDLTGIKKHYYRKHGEKKWKCDKCSKRYAVQSDWKAHSKTCGTKEYRCDCGTIFSRRDSFITHRAFCDALMQETARNPTVSFTAMAAAGGGSTGRHGFYGPRLGGGSLSQSIGNSSNSSFTPVGSYNLNRTFSDNNMQRLGVGTDRADKFGGFMSHVPNPNSSAFFMQCPSSQGLMNPNDPSFMNQHGLLQLDPTNLHINPNGNNNNNHNDFFNLGFFQENNAKNSETNVIYSDGLVNHQHHHQQDNLNTSSNMSATALLQKATQIGSTVMATANNNDPSALFRGLVSSSSSTAVDVDKFGGQTENDNDHLQGLMNSLAGGGGGIFDAHFGDNPNICGSDKLTLDLLGVGGMMRSVTGGGGGRGRGSFDAEIKFSQPNHPFRRP